MTLRDARVRRFLQKSMVTPLATLSARGQPHLTPLWFVYDGGKLYMNTRAASPAARDIAANPHVVLLFHAERARRPGQVLRIRGTARLQKSLGLRVLLRFAAKYHFSPGGLRNLLSNLGTLLVRVRYYGERTGEAGTLEVTPESFEFLPRPDV